MEVISVRHAPEWTDRAVEYIAGVWASEESRPVYIDCIGHTPSAEGPLPEWYLLLDGREIVGCAGLIPNDFISRMDLWPWLCALQIREDRRGHNYASLLIERAASDAKKAGFAKLYLCSDHAVFYEKHGFRRIGTGCHPWGETSGIFARPLNGTGEE